MVDRHDAVTSAVERWCSGFATDIVRRRPTIELGCGAQPKTCCTWNALSLDICACAPKMEEFVRRHSRFDDTRRLEIGFPALDPKLAGARSREGGCPACGGGTLTEPPAAASLRSARTNALVKHESLCPLRVPLHPLLPKTQLGSPPAVVASEQAAAALHSGDALGRGLHCWRVARRRSRCTRR